jgi:DNA-binding transcriptional LysR family regulator
MTDEREGIRFFLAVAEAKGFRAAGRGAAVSHGLRRLEERLGVTLVQQSAAFASARGERLYAAVRPALEEARAAVRAVGELAKEPRGLLRLHVSTAADSFLQTPVLADFLGAHPHIQLDLAISGEIPDIVAGG